jgi:hypothetical protein
MKEKLANVVENKARTFGCPGESHSLEQIETSQ